MFSWDAFSSQANQIIKISQEINDTWTLERGNNDPGGTYLRHKQLHHLKQGQVHQFEYHVVYSLSYNTPVLYFNIQDTAGNVMLLEEFMEYFLDRADLKPQDVDLKMAVTQMEHPVLFRPYLAIHPCKTAEVLDKTSGSKNQLITFISTFGAMVFLSLDLAYGKFC